jgi:hypothetical protein
VVRLRPDTTIGAFCRAVFFARPACPMHVARCVFESRSDLVLIQRCN